MELGEKRGKNGEEKARRAAGKLCAEELRDNDYEIRLGIHLLNEAFQVKVTLVLAVVAVPATAIFPAAVQVSPAALPVKVNVSVEPAATDGGGVMVTSAVVPLKPWF